MTRADITHVIVKGERFVGVAGMERTVLGTVSRGMTRSMATTSDKQGNKNCLQNWQGPSCNSCVKNWYGKRCSTYCVPQDSDEHGHYK